MLPMVSTSIIKDNEVTWYFLVLVKKGTPKEVFVVVFCGHLFLFLQYCPNTSEGIRESPHAVHSLGIVVIIVDISSPN